MSNTIYVVVVTQQAMVMSVLGPYYSRIDAQAVRDILYLPLDLDARADVMRVREASLMDLYGPEVIQQLMEFPK